MNFKKAIVVGAASLMMFASNGIACEGPNCDVGATINGGTFDINAKAIGGGYDYDGAGIPNGFAGGISGGGGIATGEGDGSVFNGQSSATVRTWAGGTARTDAFRTNGIGIGDKNIGVASVSTADAATGGQVIADTNPNGNGFTWVSTGPRWYQGYYAPTAGGEAHAEISGIAGQGTADISGLTESPRYNNTGAEGKTFGLVGQGSVGGFEADAYALSGPDDRSGWVQYDSKAGAEAHANINMFGGSASESYRFATKDGDTNYEGMGNFIDADTHVRATGDKSDYDNGLGYGDADLSGGYVAIGGGITGSELELHQDRGFGFSEANAKGIYGGAGELNSQYDGSLSGSTHTSAQTIDGRNGSYMGSKTTMSVTSNSGPLCADPQ